MPQTLEREILYRISGKSVTDSSGATPSPSPRIVKINLNHTPSGKGNASLIYHFFQLLGFYYIRLILMV